MLERCVRSLVLGWVLLALVLMFTLVLWLSQGVIVPALADPGNRYVDGATGTDDSNCANPLAPCETIGYALSQAVASDEILIAEGAYTETLDISLDVSLLGGYEADGWTRDIASHPTVLDANGADDSVVTIGLYNQVMLEGLIIQGAVHTGLDSYGGILIDRATVVVSGTVVQDNQSVDNGGGIYIQDDGESASLTVIRSSILNNQTASNGGGICASGRPTVTLENVVVQGNEAVGDGGGLAVHSATLRNSQVLSNTSGAPGGGMAVRYATVVSSEISYNEANGAGDMNGGGINASDGALHLEHSVLRANRVSGTVRDGASALALLRVKATILNSRISDHSTGALAVGLWSSPFTLTNVLVADNSGDAVAGDEVALTGTMMNVTIVGNETKGIRMTCAGVTVTNSIVWGNGGPDVSWAGVCTATHSNIGPEFSGGVGNFSEDPLFQNESSGDYHLGLGSPCVDRGTSDGAPVDDLDGTAREGVPDVGAYEWTGYQLMAPVVLHHYPGVHILVSGQARADQFDIAMQPFEEETGIDLVFEGVDDFETVVQKRAADGDLPDVALLPQPGLLGDLVTGGHTIDLGTWFDMSYLQQQYEQSWLDMATLHGEMAGVWYRVNVKSLVWYPLPEFQSYGYQVPQTWAELLALSDLMVAQGRTPWCIGIESGPATGWVGTDWIEDIMLRTVPPATYDQWVEGELAFSSPEVENAFSTMGDIWFNPGYVLGGRHAITTTFFGDAPGPMFDSPPSCWLHRQASFITGYFPGGADYGVDYDYFYLPPIDALYGDPVLVAGDLWGAFADRPEVRRFIEYMTTAAAVRWFVENDGWISPHRDADLDWYPAANRGIATMVMNADTVRFDGSDLMPAAVGANAFWKGVVNYVDGEDLTTVLANIDAQWP